MSKQANTRQQQLLQVLFGLGQAAPGSGSGLILPAKAASEAQLGMARHISTTILADLVQQVQKSWRHLGPGVLVIRRSADDAIWSDVADINKQRKIAEDAGDAEMASIFHTMLDKLEDIDIEHEVIVAIADPSYFKILTIPAVNPARNLHSILDSWQA